MFQDTHPVKGIPGNDIVPDHATNKSYLQFWLLDHINDTCMDAIPVTLDRSMLAVKTQGSILVGARLKEGLQYSFTILIMDRRRVLPWPFHMAPVARP